MHTFCRLFVSFDDDDDGEQVRIDVRVSADREQAPDGKPLGLVACSTLNDLGACLNALGVTGLSRFVRESESGLVTEHVSITGTELMEQVRKTRPSTVTLIAADTSLEDMNRPLELLRAKRDRGIRFRVSA